MLIYGDIDMEVFILSLAFFWPQLQSLTPIQHLEG